MSKVHHGTELHFYNILGAQFSEQLVDRNFRFFVADSYPASALNDTSKVYKSWRKKETHCYLFDDEDIMGLVNFSYGNVTIQVGAHIQEQAEEFLQYLKGQIPRTESNDPTEIEVGFWSQGSHGPSRINRTLNVASWKEINLNYNNDTREQLSDLLDKNYRPGRGGQLYLWHGEPGTGKTTALRALGREWKTWCEMHYITDPERFFGSDANYMLNVMLDDVDSDKWRCLILEDCGELLTPDARQLSGQGLSRFLNAVDGLIGQGLKFIVLVTTNEPLKKLHPAVARPGRCAAEIEFKELTSEEVEVWAKKNKLPLSETVAPPKNISELYALLEGREKKKLKIKQASVGFVA